MRTDLPSRRTALHRLVAFARGEGWELVANAGDFPRLCKPGLPAIHLGVPSVPGTLVRLDKRRRGCGECPDGHGRP